MEICLPQLRKQVKLVNYILRIFKLQYQYTLQLKLMYDIESLANADINFINVLDNNNIPVGTWTGLCTETLFSTRPSSLLSLCFRFFVWTPGLLPVPKD